MTLKEIVPHDWANAIAETSLGELEFFVCLRCGSSSPGPNDNCPSDSLGGGCQ